MGAWNSAQCSLNCGWADGDNLFVNVCQHERWEFRGLVFGVTINLNALLDHLLAKRDGERVHGGCVVRGYGEAQTRGKVCLL